MGTSRVFVLGTLGLVLVAGVVGACGGSSSSELTTSVDSGAEGGGSTSDAGDAEPPYTLDDVCERTAPVICDIRKSCCTSGPGYDEAGCLAHAKADCEKDVAAVRAGKATFHGERIEACIPKYEKIYDEACFLTFDLLQKYIRDIAGCELFEGQVPAGSTCEKTSDCMPAAAKDDFAGCDDDTKKCKITKIVPESGPCSLSDGLPTICDDGLYCDVDFGDANLPNGTCKKKASIGATCDKTKTPFTLECGLGNYCDTATSTCVVGKKGGEACASDIECRTVSCKKVDGGPGTCAVENSLVKPEECKGP